MLCLPQDGGTPLHSAAYSGNDDAVKMLLEKGANIDAVDNVSYMYMHLWEIARILWLSCTIVHHQYTLYMCIHCRASMCSCNKIFLGMRWLCQNSFKHNRCVCKSGIMLSFCGDNKAFTKSVYCAILLNNWDTLIEQSLNSQWGIITLMQQSHR